MPAIDTRILHLEKRFPLRISRGEITGSDNLFVSVMADGLVGWGEAAPGPTEGAATAEEAEALMGAFAAPGFSLSPWETDARARAEGLAPCVAAALDMALWDLLAKRAGLPLTQLLGLPRRAVPSSLTIGINPPEVAAARVPLVLAQGARALKIKLGSPEGIGADKAMYEAVRAAAAGSGARLRVDANGG